MVHLTLNPGRLCLHKLDPVRQNLLLLSEVLDDGHQLGVVSLLLVDTHAAGVHARVSGRTGVQAGGGHVSQLLADTLELRQQILVLRRERDSCWSTAVLSCLTTLIS